jgi:hypothetical protein
MQIPPSHARVRAAERAEGPAGEPTPLLEGWHRRAGGVASPRPLSRVIRDSPKSASQVSRSDGGDEYAISAAVNPAVEQSAHRRSATPNRRRHRQARTGEADFPRGEREQDAIPSARLGLVTHRTSGFAGAASFTPEDGGSAVRLDPTQP